MTSYGAAPCPHCGKTVALNHQGRTWWHTDTRNTTTPYTALRCPGTHQPPALPKDEK